jgi:hypothetical protein
MHEQMNSHALVVVVDGCSGRAAQCASVLPEGGKESGGEPETTTLISLCRVNGCLKAVWY